MISPNVVILTIEELTKIKRKEYLRGVERGKFEAHSTARGSEGHRGATESTGSASGDAAVRPAITAYSGSGWKNNDPHWPIAIEQEHAMTEAQIKHMVDRFLSWKLPEHFNPDGGISFQPLRNVGTPHEFKSQPSGTNLFDASQAKVMVRHMIEGMPPA